MAVLPIGSFEQHGAFLPLTTDTVIACTIAREVAMRPSRPGAAAADGVLFA